MSELRFVEFEGDLAVTDKPHCGGCDPLDEVMTDKPHCGGCDPLDEVVTDKPHCGGCVG